MNRRKLLSAGPAVMVLAGTGATVAIQVAAPSPILDAGRQLAALNRRHDAADVPGAGGAELDRLTRQIGELQRSIIAATPTTATEALVVLMMAAGDIGSTSGGQGAHEAITAGMFSIARASHCLAGALGVTVAEFGGGWCLPTPPAVGRAA